MTPGVHRVAIRAGATLIENWSEYEIQSDLLAPADSFTLQLGPLDPADGRFGSVYEAVKPDTSLTVMVDDVVVMTGYVDDRVASLTQDGDRLTISGRDKGGRLVDESMPLTAFSGLGILDLAQKVAGPWFDEVRLDNASNRRLVAGGGRGARTGRVSAEPAISRGARAHRKVEPGESRWAVLEYFLREAGLLAWCTADGKALIVGKPCYTQEPSYFFLHPSAGSPRKSGGNVLSMEIRHSVGERYSQIVAVGANAGNAQDYAERVTRRRGVAVNGPDEWGAGKDFQRRKVLLVSDDGIKNDTQALERAQREMAERDATGFEISLRTLGHGQQITGAPRPTLFAIDHVAHVEDEVTGLAGRFYVTQVRFQKSRGGEYTDLKLVPLETELRA